jgi:hypothetical protein
MEDYIVRIKELSCNDDFTIRIFGTSPIMLKNGCIGTIVKFGNNFHFTYDQIYKITDDILNIIEIMEKKIDMYTVTKIEFYGYSHFDLVFEKYVSLLD